MNALRFTEEQIIGMLREHSNWSKMAEVCRNHAVNEASFNKSKAKFRGMDVFDVRRLRQLEEENAQANRLLADTMLENRCLKTPHQKMVPFPARRDAVWATRHSHGICERRACTILVADKTSVHYTAHRCDDGPLRVRLRALAAERRRFGYLWPGLLLKCDGLPENHKKLRRSYAEERLRMRRRGGRKRELGACRLIAAPGYRNQRCSFDFISDTLTDGRRFRVLCTVDESTRECLSLVADTADRFRRRRIPQADLVTVAHHEIRDEPFIWLMRCRRTEEKPSDQTSRTECEVAANCDP
jgi:hypothetical protein